MVHFVYLLTFMNNKVYVGMSRTDKKGLFTNRYRQHDLAARSGKNLPVYNAWRKHGAPVQTILSKHETREDCARVEILTILQYQSVDKEFGYNLALGGEGLNVIAGSAMYELMRERVWNNAARREKCSASLKGRKPSPETTAAYKAWAATPEGKARKSAVSLEMWAQDGHREMMAERTRQQMTPEARAHLSKVKTGLPDHLTPEVRAIQGQKIAAYMATPEGKETAKRGQAVMWANPENRAKVKAGTDKWRASDRNKEQCKAMARLSALACAKPVVDAGTGIEYPSQHAMAVALGVSGATISRNIKNGKVIRL